VISKRGPRLSRGPRLVSSYRLPDSVKPAICLPRSVKHKRGRVSSLMDCIVAIYGDKKPTTLGRISRQLQRVVRASESRLQHRRRGRPSLFSKEAFRRYEAGERGSRFYSEFIPGYPLMSARERARMRKRFRSAYLYARKKRARKTDKADKLVVA